MNKKTLGRIAAVGLAGLTVIPSFGLVASADLLPTGKKNSDQTAELIAGSAYKLTWEVKAIKHTYSLGANNQVLDSQTVTTDIGLGTYDGKDTQYYQYSINATTIPVLLEDAFTQQNNNWKKYKAEWDFYSFATKYSTATIKTAGSAVDKDGTLVYYRNAGTADSPAWGFYTANSDGTYTLYGGSTSEPTASADNDIEYVWVTKPTRTELSASALITELGSDKINIIAATNEIEAATDGAYQLSATGTTTGTTTGSTSTNTTSDASIGLPAAAYRTSSDTAFKSAATGFYYPNLSALRSAEPNASYTTSTVAVPYSATNCFFDALLGYYTSANSTGYAYVVSKGTSSNDTAVYKVNGYYYPTYTAAYNAANGNTNLIQLWRDYSTLPSNYFSQVTGSFYSTYADALKASGNNASRVTVFNNASIDDTNYLDPYYYYWLNKQQSSTSKDTSSATLGKRTGWTSIANYLSKVSSGSSATIAMNDETTVPASVLAAIKGRNVTVKFVLDNGATFTVNGKDVTSAKNVDIDVTYNTKSISKKLIQTAYSKNDAVSSAQLSIDAASLGFNSDLTVKFSSKRAGYKAKIYRYNASRNSLVLVDTATVGSNGKTTFDNITKGGEFVVVLYK